VAVVVSDGDGTGVSDAVGGVVSVGDGVGVSLGIGVGAGPPPPTGALVAGIPGTPALDSAGWLATRVDPSAGVDGAGHDA
jgi:hypothetical protein